MANQILRQGKSRMVQKQPQAKKLPDLRNEKTYEKLLKVAANEVRESRKLRLTRALRLLGG